MSLQHKLMVWSYPRWYYLRYNLALPAKSDLFAKRKLVTVFIARSF